MCLWFVCETGRVVRERDILPMGRATLRTPLQKTGDRPRFCVRLAKNEGSRKRILMPRHARIVAAGFPLHAILRGIDRSAICFDDADDRALLGMLVERAAAESVWVHA